MKAVPQQLSCFGQMSVFLYGYFCLQCFVDVFQTRAVQGGAASLYECVCKMEQCVYQIVLHKTGERMR